MSIQTLEAEVRVKVTMVAKALCCHPEDLEVFVEQQAIGLGNAIAVRIRPHRGDISRVIGVGGRTFRALQVATERLGRGTGVPVTLGKVLEGEKGERDEFVPTDAWPTGRMKLTGILGSASSMLFDGATLYALRDAPGPFAVAQDAEVTIAQFRVTPGPGFPSAVNALVVLAEAIGRNFGRVVRATVEPVDLQPTSADGRHVREVRR